MTTIIQNFIPKGMKNNPGYTMNPLYITIHTTANKSKGANAKAHNNFCYNGGGAAGVSFHFCVDDSIIYQNQALNLVCWHAGDGGNGTGNRKSIAIEICENVDGNFEKAVENAIWLVKKLMKEHSISISNVVPHKHWSGKNCPAPLLSKWEEFINKVKEEKKPAPTPKAGTHIVKQGETLSGIAKFYNVRVSDLASLNKIENINVLKLGQVLTLPTKKATVNPIYHVVKAGDTVSELAAKYGSSNKQIKEWNNLDEKYTLSINKKLRVK